MSDNWYLEEDFWRTFGRFMFNEASFAEGKRQVESLTRLVGIDGGQVLDLGAGPGRHAVPLAAQGYTVTAVDTSHQLLSELMRRAGNLEIEALVADMREFHRERAFDLVLVMWTSFGYFEAESDHRRVLDRIFSSLRPGGRLVLDLVGLEYLCRNLQPVHLTEDEEGRLLIERPLLTDDLTRLENEWILVDGNTVHRTDFSHRVWSAGEISLLLNQAGLDLVAIHGGYDGEPYDLDAERLIVIAERPPEESGNGEKSAYGQDFED